MYLKSIEIHGFKSFANKIVFKFKDGITGIVGPNGSGKSNVSDAVRWVLGEQRIKQLRGVSMQDVIFSGTELRKPLSYAYVAITLDNSDHQLAVEYDEVTIARRIYRSGESEYLLNGTLCRLKDVNEIFYDTGIGKDGYSIIGQGQIDKILSGKPEERRELFDEAAGIVKFKRRKLTSLKKLEEEQQNLVRVKDILSEQEKQVGPLEKQSETAKIYLKYKEELKTLDVNMFLLDNSRIREQLKSVEEKYGIASEDLAGMNEKYEAVRKEYEEIQNEIEMLEESIENARTTLTDTSVLRGKLQGEINVLEEKIHSGKSNLEHLGNRRETVQKEINLKQVDRDAILREKNDIDVEVRKMISERDTVKAKLEQVQQRIEELNNCIESGKNSIIGELNQRASIKSKMGRYDTMLEQIQIRKAELNSRLIHAKSDEVKQVENIKELRETFNRITSELGKMNETVAEQEKTLAGLRESIAKKDAKLRTEQMAYHQGKSRLDALLNITERYEGYGGSVKKVMELKEKEKGIIGVVADIISTEKKYETAIETALGGNIQNIVTDNEETAKNVIAYLKDNKAGRATFLPLTSITNPQKFKNPEALEEEGALGMADDLVQTEKKYRDVARAMLGRILVVDHVDHAVKIARKYGYGIRMVTLEGELLVPGGAISGGAFKNNSNLLSRRREIDELTGDVDKHLQDSRRLEKEIEEEKGRRNKLRLETEQYRTKIQEEFILQNTARLNVEQAEEKMHETEEGFGSLKEEEQEIETKISEIRSEKESIQKELALSEENERSFSDRITEYQAELEERRGEETEESAKVSEWDLKVEKMTQKQEFQQQNVDRIQEEIERSNGELEEIVNGISEISLDIESKEKDQNEIEQTIQASHTTQNESEVKLKEDQARKETLTAKQKSFFKDREEMADQISALDKEVYRLNAQKEKLEESVESQINYMWDEYEITLSDAASLRDETMNNLPAMKRDISSIKEKIRKLGDVNVNAIEDYKNLMDRYTFMKTQYEDLVESEKNLNKIIEQLDESMRKQFREKFGQITREFDKVFKEMFGGGRGSLELMEDEDILEAGISITAQPPGKKLQNMMQLSGGEKALTAIALLFAIQNLKPSPFCLLDEIDAALDENNVVRFARYLQKLTKNTQFIVITHRRGTMERCNSLYGITMQEKGVSALVSVNLIEDELSN